MEKIYVVTADEYSGYHIKAVFDEKELAEKYIKMLGGDPDDIRIEEYPINPNKHELTNGYKPFFLKMTRDGKAFEVNKDLEYYFNCGNIEIDFQGNMRISMFAKDEKHAIKIANEKRLQVIAGNHWIPNNYDIKL